MVYAHLNIRSLLPKMDEIRHCLSGKSSPAIIAFTETWLDDTIVNGEIAVQGYNVYMYHHRDPIPTSFFTLPSPPFTAVASFSGHFLAPPTWPWNEEHDPAFVARYVCLVCSYQIATK